MFNFDDKTSKQLMFENIKVIGFDADDTLWANEPYYQDVERKFCHILKPYSTESETSRLLSETEIQNLAAYGYGAKSFILSMLETALKISNGAITATETEMIIASGRTLLDMPVILLNGVENVLQELKQRHYKLIVATKGDLLDQERKLQQSGLTSYFHHIEVMSEKDENSYRKLIAHLDIEPSEFLMVGNSVRSDILPVTNIGAKAIHVPFEITWEHEQNHPPVNENDYLSIVEISEILNIIKHIKH